MAMPANPSQIHHPLSQSRSQSAPENASQSSSATAQSVSLEDRWTALQLKTERIARLADLGPEQDDTPQEAFKRDLAQADERTASVVERGVEDMELLAAMGLKALEEVHSRHQNAHAPALALWRELYHARQAVLSVLDPVPA